MHNAIEINAAQQEKAIALHAALAAIDVPAIAMEIRDRALDRHAPRKEFAAAVRKLFKRLGLKGISVTAPNYSMATSIDIALPSRQDYVFETASRYDVIEGDVARAANNEASRKVSEILQAAYPSHRDRSESGTDYFDFKWMVS